MATVAVGLMSGTSGDGVDAALLDTDGENKIGFLGGLTLPYEDDLRGRLLEASQHDVPLTELLRVEKEVSEHHVNAVRQLLSENPKLAKKVELVGFHGHTVRHSAGDGISMQIGNPWILARALGLPIVCDFRRCDIAGGGQGAPLVGMFHRALFSKEPRPTVVLNLGGVANVTWLGEKDEIIAGDTGPGCGLIDEWAQTMADMPHDRDGRLALAGKVDRETVEAALDSPFFGLPLPKSADRFDFDHVDVSALSVEDGAATLCAVTAEEDVGHRRRRASSGVDADARRTAGRNSERQQVRAESRHARGGMLCMASSAAPARVAADHSGDDRLREAAERRNYRAVRLASRRLPAARLAAASALGLVRLGRSL
jgi:anhydro-N-acetylmuramic acid kinase